MSLREQLDPSLRRAVLAALPEGHEDPELARFYRLLRDYPGRGGKRLRGLATLLTTAAHGGDPRAALPVAAALELFQSWVLVHDDVEDGSEQRRGRPALHRQIGAPLAINVGDALHVYMWRLLVDAPLPRRDDILREFLETITRTAEGQHLDLAWVASGRLAGEEEYLRMVALKTARYTVVAPLRLGALCAGREPDARLARAGTLLGSAFQIRDDVLNLLPPERTGGYGKEFAGDLYEGKRTLVLAHAFGRLEAGAGERLRVLLSRPREAKRDEEMSEALELLNRHDSLDHAQRLAERYADEGLALLDEALRELPGREAVAELTELLASLVARSR